MNKVSRLKEILWIVAMFGLVALVLRTFLGLGATTNLTDAMPWGLWKIFNMVAGVALATGGFAMACVVYVLHLKKYQSLMKPAIVVAFLGYGVSCFSLMWDIGLPHRIWHPIMPWMWNHHSFLFEVAWCVMLYFTVSFIELSPTVLEKFPWTEKITHFLHRWSVPLVIFGITLSTLHHTSLGSLFLVAPARLHPLWYSGDWLPFQFITSAVGAGMMTVVLVALAYAYFYNKEADRPALEGISKASAVILAIFLALRVAELTIHRKWGIVFSGQWESYVFGVEFITQTIIPIVIITLPRLRKSVWGLATAGLFATFGLSMHRLDTGITGFVRWLDTPYFPSVAEFAFSLGVYAAAGLIFIFLAENFDVFEKVTWGEKKRVTRDFRELQWDAIASAPARISLVIVIAIPAAILMFSTNALKGFPLVEQPVAPPKAVDGLRLVLNIDGNHNGDGVLFNHEEHKKRQGGEQGCVTCHHLNLPGDKSSSCSRCHTDMMLDKSIFNHALHEDKLKGSESCAKCHALDRPEARNNVKECYQCHAQDMGMPTPANGGRYNEMAASYEEAMHGMCVKCHQQEASRKARPQLAECATCHPPAQQ